VIDMKIAIPAAALLLFFGTAASVSARQDRPQDNQHGDHKEAGHQEGKPEQKGARPAQEHGKPAPSHAQHPAHPQQHVVRSQQHPVSHPEHANARPAPHAHGRISDAHYRASFGSEHRFHVSRGDYEHHMFRYGGYQFRFVDPWPRAWAYSDPVYVVYVDGGYYMYDPVHPGIRITLNIF
jgi:hypothetical protein